MNVVRMIVLIIAIASGVPMNSWGEDVPDEIQPNDYVDVILTLKESDVSSTARRSAMILRNVRVLAINPKTEPGTQFLSGDKFTLELSPEQSRIVSASWRIGILSLPHHSRQDETDVPTPSSSSK